MPDKICSKCGKPKDIKHFHKQVGGIHGVGGQCRTCRSKAQLRYSKSPKGSLNMYKAMILRKYGLSILRLQNIMDRQKGCCGCCGETLIHPYSKATFAIDHCHDTGVVRGLLCNNCNLGIGSLGDNLEGLLKAVQYLKENYHGIY